MNRNTRKNHVRAIIGLGLMMLASPARAQFFEHKEHHLGPTGLYGVTSPRDITITKVEKGSPADGRIKEGDVIIAAGGVPFNEQTRKQLAAAIDKAESEEGGGTLSFTLKNGKSVELKLPVLGSYSDTAPFNCAKTDAIITRTADYLVRTKDFGRKDMPIALLGLLATGEDKYIDFVKQEVHAAPWAKPELKLSLDTYNRTTWSWGYTALFLCEYYLLTKDQYVLPAIETYAVALAEGRDAAGLWGHGMATRDLNGGKLHGRLPGYAVMNQSSLPCFISLLMAEKCGVKHPEVQAGIRQTGTFYEGFIGRGTLPYGVHDPKPKDFNNNGMSGLAAVAFSLRGDKEGTAFFSRMSAAAHNQMETGHTGHFFNQLWTGPGANLAGPETTSAFFRETRWLHTLNRKWDGNFTYDCCGYKQGIFSYRGLSDAGSHLVNHCLGRRKLLITGRDADPSIWLKGGEVRDTLALAILDMKTKTDEELLACFGHPMPKIRGEAVWILRERPHKLLGSITAMMKQGSKEQRLSAIGYFGYQCPPGQASAAIGDLGNILRDPAEDMEIRAAAAASLGFQGEATHLFFGDILKLVVAEKPGDPLGRFDEQLGASLIAMCPDPYAAGLVNDKPLFYGAATKLMENKRANARTHGMSLVSNIPLEDFHHVADHIDHILADKDLTYHSYHNLGPQTGAIGILANHRINGGIEAAFRILDSDTGKHGFKLRMLMAVMPKYGAAAKDALPRLKAMSQPGGRFEKPWNEMIRAIESAEGSEETISIEEARKAGKQPEVMKR